MAQCVHHSTFESGTGSEYASEEGSGDFSAGQQELEAEADRQLIHQQHLLIRRLTDENRLLRQADQENEDESCDLRLRLASAEKRVVNFESLRRLRISMEEENDTLRASLAQEKGRSITLETRVSSLEQEKTGLLAKLGAAEDEEHTLRKKLECLQDDYNSALQLFGGSGSDDASLAGIHEQLAQSADRTQALEQRLGDLMNTCNDLRTEKGHLEAQLGDLQTQQRGRTPDTFESIVRVQVGASEQVGVPVNQSTPLREHGDLRRELLQTLGGNKSPLLGVDGCKTPASGNQAVDCVSPTPSDGSIFDFKTTSSASELLDVVAAFRDHFDEKKTLALQQVADLSHSFSVDVDDTASRHAKPLNGDMMVTFEDKLRKLVASRNQTAKKALAARQQLKAARADLTVALEQREQAEKLAKEVSAECESLRQRLLNTEAERAKMASSPSITDSSNESLSASPCHAQPVSPALRTSPSTESPIKSTRRRLRTWSRGDSADMSPSVDEEFTDSSKLCTPPMPAKTSCFQSTVRFLLYSVAVFVLLLVLVVFVCPVLSGSQGECCACPSPWVRSMFGDLIVASPVQPSPH
ncbi:uncharacterized protein LOC135813949 isoform X2 [Sycon ciliatum]|uniref:uncharacterized protein LOC135813949 isoform X2 n=1 Tax=Sycon ciliatum TaxID=27933 RepID=UPI0031F68FB0